MYIKHLLLAKTSQRQIKLSKLFEAMALITG